jgi:hypothetical protein
LDPVAAHVGRHRVFGIARSGLNQSIPVYAMDRFGAILGATAVVTQTDQTKWQLVDLGEIQVPARATGQEEVPTQYVQLYGGGGSGAVVVASPGLHLNGLLFLPLDYSAGIMVTGGGVADLIGDGFSGFSIFGGPMNSGRVGDLGGVWTKIAGQFEGWSFENSGWISPVSAGLVLTAGATAFYGIGSGRQSADVFAEAGFNISGPTPSVVGASDAHVAIYPKMTPSGPYVKAHLSLGPSPYVAIISGGSPGAKNLRASAGMPSIGASGIFQGQAHKLAARILAGRMDVWVATGALAASPAVSASHGEIGLTGYPGIDVKQSPDTAAAINVRRFAAYEFGATAVGIGARETFRFESFPEGRVVQGNASVFQADRLADYRGGFPKIPPMGSGAESPGPGRMVVFQGEIDNVVGNDGPDIALSALERFRFLV